jgi:predicted ATPase/class 3 adenylate cyclase
MTPSLKLDTACPDPLGSRSVMAKLPTGTVTLLFTDIEGSTQLLERLGDHYVEILATHRRLLRAAFAQFRGREVGTEGDAFFVAFAKACDAVAAAVAGQRALAHQPWPDGATLRVRMGIHTGEPMVVANDYIGLDVHLAARICSAGHGGQVLLSQIARELLGNDLPHGVGLQDLGEHRLKDLRHPQRLVQLVISDLPTDFPSPRTLGAYPTGLPTQLTRFVGRQPELAEVQVLLQRDEVRLLTLTGPGGTGKTRLAIQVAAGLVEVFPNAVVFIGLAPVNDPGLVVSTIAQGLGVREATHQSLFESLIQQVGDRRLLLVLDNFEQVLGAAPVVVHLLAACPQLTVLVTSRAALHVSGEHIYPVPPMSLSGRDDTKGRRDIAVSEAVMLFVERAQAINPSFAVTDANALVLAEICRRLDGLPLAIELAAARSRLLPPQALLTRLERRLELLKGGARDLPARQQTLRATIDWSYDLLEPGEQTLFARLAVFAGGCTLQAAEVVCNQDDDLDVIAGLDALADKNLVQPHHGPDGDPRLLLLETLREYGLERLAERGEADAAARRHADYYLGLAEQAEWELLGPRQGVWYDRLDADRDNFRAALAWSLTHQNIETTGRLAGALMAFWVSRGHASEGLRWLDAALERRAGLSQPALAKALFAKAYLLLQAGAHHGQTNRLVEESLSLFQELGEISWTVRAVSVLGWAAMRAGEVDRGLALREQAVGLARDSGGDWDLALALGNLGLSLLRVSNHARARAALEESLAIYQRLEEAEGIALVLYGLGMLALGEDNPKRAWAQLEEALVLARKIGHIPSAANLLAGLGIIALHNSDYRRAATLFEESLTLAQQVEDELLIAECLWGVAAVAAGRRQPVRAVRLWGAARALDYTRSIPAYAVRSLEERLLIPTRSHLDAGAFDAAWAGGQAMSRENAIAYALVDDEKP